MSSEKTPLLNNKQTHILLSWGQISGSDTNKSISAFAELLPAGSIDSFYIPIIGCMPCLTNAAKRLTITRKLYTNDGIINQYKKGNIDFEEFSHKTAKRLGIENNEEKIRQAWNAMCKIENTQTIDNLRQVLELQRQEGFKLCIFGATNEAQAEYIKQQLRKEGVELENNRDIQISSSYENGFLDERELVKDVLGKSGLKSKDRLISLHNRFKTPSSIGLQVDDFEYASFDSRKDNLLEIISSKVKSLEADPSVIPGKHAASLLRNRKTNTQELPSH